MERQKKAKAEAEKLNKDLAKVCIDLKHRMLAFVVSKARDERKGAEV